MSIAVAALGVDYSGARPAPSSISISGGGFILRYSAGVGNSRSNVQWKLCGTGEIKAAVAAGLDFIANCEWYETRITEGAGAGAADGAADLTFWQSRGLAKGASIYCSWDTDPVSSKWAAVDAYLHAYDQALRGYYHVDCYAGTPYLRHALARGLIRYGWRPNAGSWSNDGLPYQPDTSTAAKRAALVKRAVAATPAAIWQTGNYWFSKNADENLIIRPNVGSHMQAIAAADKPKPPAPITESDPILEFIMSLPGAPKGLTYDQFLASVAHAVLAQQVTNLQGTDVTLSYMLRAMDDHINKIEAAVTSAAK